MSKKISILAYSILGFVAGISLTYSYLIYYGNSYEGGMGILALPFIPFFGIVGLMIGWKIGKIRGSGEKIATLFPSTKIRRIVFYVMAIILIFVSLELFTRIWDTAIILFIYLFIFILERKHWKKIKNN